MNGLIHARFINKNEHAVKFVMMLGDDNLMGFDTEPDVANLGVDIAQHFNMQSTYKIS